MRRLLVAVICLAAVAVPAVAAACPSCAGRDDPGIGVGVMVGLLIAVPYAVATVAIRVIRRVENGETR